MFTKIQKYLLLNHPLLWNTNVAPVSFILLAFHIIFFLIGYINGTLDFNQTSRNYISNDGVVIFFGVLVSIVTVILWLVFYFKNNAFKALYPKDNFSLFKEWLLIFFVCFAAGSFTLSYFFGVDVKIRSYYSENEAKKRCKTLSEASIFYGEHYDTAEQVDSLVNDTVRPVSLDHVLFKDKKYPLNSLINKDINNYSFYDSKWDSLTKIRVKTWLVNNQQDSVKAVMKNYFAMVKEHRLKSNIDADQWFKLVYTAPDFVQKRIIALREKDYYNNGNYNYDYENEYETYAVAVEEVNGERRLDSINEYLKVIGKDEYVFYKTYIPGDQLEYNYNKIAETYTSPAASIELLLAFLYLGVALSVLLFSFKVTSGRRWLIALISMAVLNILLGIMTAIFNIETFYLIALLVVFLLLFTYFIIVIMRKTTNGISGITLNGTLWILPGFLPITYQLLIEFLRHIYGYYDYNSYNYNVGFDYDKYPLLKFLKDNGENMLWFNLVFIVLAMLFFSVQIKKWKALADN